MPKASLKIIPGGNSFALDLFRFFHQGEAEKVLSEGWVTNNFFDKSLPLGAAKRVSMGRTEPSWMPSSRPIGVWL